MNPGGQHYGPTNVMCPYCGEAVTLPCHPSGSAQHGGCSQGHHFMHYDGAVFTLGAVQESIEEARRGTA